MITKINDNLNFSEGCEQSGFPSIKQEDWKYTNLSAIRKYTYVTDVPQVMHEEEVLREYCESQDINLVFVNGVFSSKFSNLEKMPEGVKLLTIKDALAQDSSCLQKFEEKCAWPKATPFTSVNKDLAEDGVFIEVNDNAISKTLIHIVHVTSLTEENLLTAPRTCVLLGKSSEANVLETHVCFNDKNIYFSCAQTDIYLQENARLQYIKAVKESLQAFHVGQTRVFQEGNSCFDGFSLSAGGKIVRNDLDAIVNGEGAETIINGLYTAWEDQHVDNHTSVEHKVANCGSHQLYKGVLNDSARAVFNGKIFVRPPAQKTNSYQLNKNLLLGDGCRVDTKPQLEIFADDVKCTHGATIGQLNKDEMFYMQTRGVSQRDAVKMLYRAFVEDVLDMIKNDHVHQKLNSLLQPAFCTKS